MNDKEREVIDVTIDKSRLSVESLSDISHDEDYWLTRKPEERLKHVEVLRRINYGPAAVARLQKILEIVQK